MNKYITAGFKDEMVKTSFAKPPKLKKVLNYAKDYANENPYKTLGAGTAAALTGGVAVASQKADKEEIKEFSDSNLGASPSVSDETLETEKNVNENDILSKDSIVYKENNEYRVRSVDLEMVTPEYALVKFMGGDYKIFASEIPETYDEIKKNPRYSYIIKKIEVQDRNDITVYLESIYDNHTKKINLEFDKTIIDTINFRH
jgi:hypothetical protein